MNILIAHNYYQLPGGEDVVVANETALLKDAGCNVMTYSVNNNSIKKFTEKFVTFYRSSYSPKAKYDFSQHLAKMLPDIVHVHNFFPILTPSIYDACAEMGIPVVQTLHNYRLICPNGQFLHNGKICEKCLPASPYLSVFRRCYRNSIIATFAVAHMLKVHRRLNTWSNKVNQYVVLSNFAKKKFIEGGLPRQLISVKPNFTADPCSANETQTKPHLNGAVFVGRLSHEKGVSTLLEAWRHVYYPLRIIGDGPLFVNMNNTTLQNVECLGRLTAEQVSQEMSKASFLIMPSECYETFGMVIIEAFAHSVPVIVSRLGAMAEIVDDGITGLFFEPGNPQDLVQKVQWMQNHPEECLQMGKNARCAYEAKYLPEKNLQKLISIYSKVRSSL